MRSAALAPPDPSEWAGTDRYVVRRRIGQGGMGIVYEAFDRRRRRVVALKTLRHATAAASHRLEREFRAIAGVTHPNLVRLYDLVATDGGRVFFTMELVRGTDFLTHVRAEGARASGRTAGHPGPGAAPRGRPEPRGPVPHEDDPTLRLPPVDSPAAPPLDTAGADARPYVEADVERLRPALRQLVDAVHAVHLAGK